MNGLGNKKIMARNIQRLMDKAGKTRLQVCDDLGIKYTTFTDWINANTYPRIDKIELLAQYFGVSKADLVEEHSTETKLEKLTAKIKALQDGMDRMLAAQNRRHSQIRALIGSTVETPRDLEGLDEDADRLIQEIEEFYNTKLVLLPLEEQQEILAKISALSKAGVDAIADEAIKQREIMKRD